MKFISPSPYIAHSICHIQSPEGIVSPKVQINENLKTNERDKQKVLSNTILKTIEQNYLFLLEHLVSEYYWFCTLFQIHHFIIYLHVNTYDNIEVYAFIKMQKPKKKKNAKAIFNCLRKNLFGILNFLISF